MPPIGTHCERCNSTEKLTNSHAPGKAFSIFDAYLGKGWTKRQRIYCLCQSCHDVYTNEIEGRIIRDAAKRIMAAHELYVMRPSLMTSTFVLLTKIRVLLYWFS